MSCSVLGCEARASMLISSPLAGNQVLVLMCRLHGKAAVELHPDIVMVRRLPPRRGGNATTTDNDPETRGGRT